MNLVQISIHCELTMCQVLIKAVCLSITPLVPLSDLMRYELSFFKNEKKEDWEKLLSLFIVA